ncbi:acyltransferase [Flavobacterium anhuiense]|uniref:acyltransferase n=1 Tax=Flavobacterium anhuiense TaxID=459526 RepID=UPI003D98A462
MIHPLSDVQTAYIGENTYVWQFTIILKNAKIGSGCNINCHVFIENNVVIGNNVTIKPGVYVWDGITIENDVMIGPNVTFTNDKLPRSKNQNYKMECTTVKRGASIGAGATILCGIEIGQYALIGAGTLITKSVPARALVIGTPGKIVGWVNEDGTKMKKFEDYYIDNTGESWMEIEGLLVKM